MTPILYEKNETAFITNGICRLRDAISCEVVEERNGIYECDFEYPVNGANYEQIQFGRIIGVSHDEAGDVQPFEIVSAERPINGVVKFHAVHISYRQTQIVVAGENINSLADAFTLLGNGAPANPFTYWTDKTNTGYLASCDGTPRSVRQILGGVDGSILDVYGGEYEFDGFTVKLWENRGQTRDFAVRYGVNLLDYTEQIDYAGTFTSCVAFWRGNDGQIVKTTASLDMDGYNGNDTRAALDLSDRFDTAPSTADLGAAALEYMTANQTYLPAQNIKVDFVRLQDMPEFSEYAPLLTCNLCDRINVIFPQYNAEGLFKIVRTVWDTLKGRYIEMELGALQTTLAGALGISEGNSSAITSTGGGAVRYGTCTTAAATAAKTASVSPTLEALDTGTLIFVKFRNANGVANPTLNVDGTGAKSIKRYGTTAPSTSAASSWNAGSIVALVYDGTYWQIVGWLNTTYSSMTQAEMQTGTSTTARLITPARLKEAVLYHIKPTFNTFTPATGSTMSGRTCYYTKSGNTVNVFFAVEGLTAQSNATIYTLPSGYRPKYKITVPVNAGARSDYCSCDIDTDGSVVVSTHATRTYAIALVSFIVE